jgi:hypothetical protein
VGEVTQRTVIEQALDEVDAALRSASPSPAVRELRVRHLMLRRVVQGWAHAVPHDPQIAAMLECALDLQGQVLRVCAASPAPPAVAPRIPSRPPSLRAIPARPLPARPTHAMTTRPPPRRDAQMRTTRPPGRRSVPPPSRPPGR